MGREVDHRGEELPPLTKRSKNVNLDRILKFHRTDFSPKPLATPGLWPIFSQMTKYGEQHTLRRTWYHYHETDPNDGPGVLAVSWHTAGLVDPALIIHQIKKDYVFAGRQDILTGPIIGWWGRRMGVQPLLRQAERKRGYVDDETATRVNSSSMLTVASKLAHGHGSVLMPEGHSHSEWHILRLRTGSIRSALNAAAIARELGNEPPVILPIGLTFREPQSWYSEVLVEFSKPIEMPKLPDVDHGKREIYYKVSGQSNIFTQKFDNIEHIKPLRKGVPYAVKVVALSGVMGAGLGYYTATGNNSDESDSEKIFQSSFATAIISGFLGSYLLSEKRSYISSFVYIEDDGEVAKKLPEIILLGEDNWIIIE